MANSEWIYEFLYRGYANEPGAWHIILMDQMGRQMVLNMKQAEERGYDITTILQSLNAETLKELEQTREENRVLNSNVENLSNEIERLGEEILALKATPEEGQRDA